MSFYKEVPGRKTTLESTLKFDTTPTAGSTNPVTSDGVKSAIDGAVGDASEAIQEQIDDIAEKAGSGYTPKGEASVATLNALSGQENGELYTMTDAGTLTDGSLAVVAGDTVAWDATNEVWYKAMDYAPRQYGTNEVHNLPTSITAFRTGDVIPVDGPSGTAKMSKVNLLNETSEAAKTKFYDTPELSLKGYAGFNAIGFVGTDAKNFRLGDNLKLIYNDLENYHKEVKVVDNDVKATSQYYIYVKLDIKAGVTYVIKLERSAVKSSVTKLQSRNALRQSIEDIGYFPANSTEYYFVFTATQNADYICIFDTTNDGESYTTNAVVYNPTFVEETYKLYGYYPRTLNVVRGARYGNSTWPNINSTPDRITTENLLELDDGCYVTMLLDGYTWGMIQSNYNDGTGLFVDSGWKSVGEFVKVVRKYQSIGIRKLDNTNITDDEFNEVKRNIKFVLNGEASDKGIKLSDFYLYKDEMIKCAKANFINRNIFTLASHATWNPADATNNTAASTHFAANRGFICVENDIDLTSDGYFVLNHEDDIRINFVNNDGTEIESAVYITSSTLEDLRDNYKTRKGGYKICTLQEQLEICASRNLCLIAEIKNFEADNLDKALEVIALCRKYLGYENFALTSFNEQLLDLIRSNDKSVTLIYISYRNNKPDLDKISYSFGNSVISIDYYSVAQYDGVDRGYDEYVAEAKEKGIVLGAWTLEPTDVAKVMREGNYRLATTNISCPGNICGKIVSNYNGRKQNWEGWSAGTPQWHNGTVVDGTLVLASGKMFTYSFANVVNAKMIIRIIFDGKLNINDNYGNTIEMLGTEFDGGCYEVVFSVGKTTEFTGFIIKNNQETDAVIKDLELYLVEC